MRGSRVFSEFDGNIVDGARGENDRAGHSQIRDVSECLHLRTIRD